MIHVRGKFFLKLLHFQSLSWRPRVIILICKIKVDHRMMIFAEEVPPIVACTIFECYKVCLSLIIEPSYSLCVVKSLNFNKAWKPVLWLFGSFFYKNVLVILNHFLTYLKLQWQFKGLSAFWQICSF